jgi:hypothetical protein
MSPNHWLFALATDARTANHPFVVAGTLPFNWPSFAKMQEIYLSNNKLEGQVTF